MVLRQYYFHLFSTRSQVIFHKNFNVFFSHFSTVHLTSVNVCLMSRMFFRVLTIAAILPSLCHSQQGNKKVCSLNSIFIHWFQQKVYLFPNDFCKLVFVLLCFEAATLWYSPPAEHGWVLCCVSGLTRLLLSLAGSLPQGAMQSIGREVLGKGTTALVVRVLAPPGGPGKETGNSLSGRVMVIQK